MTALKEVSGASLRIYKKGSGAGTSADPFVPNVAPLAGDGNPTEFSCAAVGAHVSGADISNKITLTKPAGATAILIQAITKDACYTLDGTDPTATSGFVLYAGNDPYIIPVPGTAIEIIEAAATCRLEYQWIK